MNFRETRIDQPFGALLSGKSVWTTGAESLSKVSPQIGLGPWMALFSIARPLCMWCMMENSQAGHPWNFAQRIYTVVQYGVSLYNHSAKTGICTSKTTGQNIVFGNYLKSYSPLHDLSSDSQILVFHVMYFGQNVMMSSVKRNFMT